MKMKISSFTISVTWIKIIAWVAGVWFFLALILALTGATSARWILFQSTDHIAGDKGAVIIITTWLFAVVTSFVKHRIMKGITGSIFFLLCLILLIGALITSTSVDNIVSWLIPTIIGMVASVLWILEAFKVIPIQKKSKAAAKN